MGIRTVTRGGKSFDVIDEEGPFNNSVWNFWNDFETNFEPHTLDVLSTLNRDDRYVDVGAWIGPTILWAAEFCDSCTGFEPDPIAYGYLKQNVKYIDEIQVYPYAIGSRRSTIRLDPLGDSNTTVSYIGTGSEVVQCYPLDGLIEHADFIKIDTEGFELEVLLGARDLINRCGPRMLIAMHPHLWRDPTVGLEVWDMLDDLDYVIEPFETGDLYVHRPR